MFWPKAEADASTFVRNLVVQLRQQVGSRQVGSPRRGSHVMLRFEGGAGKYKLDSCVMPNCIGRCHAGYETQGKEETCVEIGHSLLSNGEWMGVGR